MGDFQDFKQFLPKALLRYQMERESRAALICKRFRDLCPRIVGEDSVPNVRPKFFKGHTLYVSVPDSLWAQRVHVHRHDLIMKINLEMGDGLVRDIRTSVDFETSS